MRGQFTVLEKIPAVLCGFVMRCGNRAAESGFGPASKGKCKEMKRRT
jgi:hypothetical protein